MNKRFYVLIALLVGFTGCAGMGSDIPSTQVNYNPILDEHPNDFFYEWEDEPEYPPRKPLPIDPLIEKAD